MFRIINESEDSLKSFWNVEHKFSSSYKCFGDDFIHFSIVHCEYQLKCEWKCNWEKKINKDVRRMLWKSVRENKKILIAKNKIECVYERAIKSSSEPLKLCLIMSRFNATCLHCCCYICSFLIVTVCLSERFVWVVFFSLSSSNRAYVRLHWVSLNRLSYVYVQQSSNVTLTQGSNDPHELFAAVARSVFTP